MLSLAAFLIAGWRGELDPTALWVAVLAPLAFPVGLYVSRVSARLVTVQMIDQNFVWFTGAHPTVLRDLPLWPRDRPRVTGSSSAEGIRDPGAFMTLIPIDGVGPPLRVQDGTVVGRLAGSDVRIDQPAVAERHAVLEVASGRWGIVDETSARRESTPLMSGQVLRFGSRKFLVDLSGQEPAGSEGLWRGDSLLVMTRAAALPPRCVRCGEAARGYFRSRVEERYVLLWMLLDDLPLPLPKSALIDLPMCAGHSSSWRTVRRHGITLQGIDKNFIWLEGVHETVLQELPLWPGGRPPGRQ